MRSATRTAQLVCALALVGACGGGGDAVTPDSGVIVYPDAPETIPTLTSFSPSPATVTAGVPTAITWSWSYQIDPPVPTPTCTIDNGIGQVTNGQMTTVTLTATTKYRLTCANRAGMTSRDTVISIPPAAPNINAFTVTPGTPLTPNAATTVTFNWTYATPPSPTPTCTIDAGIGAATQGMTTSLTLPQARTFRLRCTSTLGTSTRDVTVGVDECTAGTHDCGANATCTDTPESYTCSCNSGYSMINGICSASCTAGCGANAACNGSNFCACNTGYIGDGLTCTRARLTFVTSTTYTGNIGGLAAADAACQARAVQGSLPGTYVAWLSDATSDAYCRAHGLPGKKANNCGQAALPATAGPWVRADVLRTPAAPTIDKLLAPTRQTFNPVNINEFGTEVTTTPLYAWTGTDDSGALAGTACADWTSVDSSGTIRGAVGDLVGGGTAWTDQGADFTCNQSARLRCVEVAAGSGPALPPRRTPNARKAFVTSVTGTGLLSTWADAGGTTGITAADAICQARARYAGYTNAQYFRAWASYSTLGAASRVFSSGPWYRPDGIQFATRSMLTGSTSGRISAPLYQTELNTYLGGNAEAGSVWTGTTYTGGYYTSSASCSSWATTASSGVIGRHDVADFRWVAFGTSTSVPSLQSCAATDYRLYCVEDF